MLYVLYVIHGWLYGPFPYLPLITQELHLNLAWRDETPALSTLLDSVMLAIKVICSIVLVSYLLSSEG